MHERDDIAQVFKGFVGIWIYLGCFVWIPSIGMQYELRKPWYPRGISVDLLESPNSWIP